MVPKNVTTASTASSRDFAQQSTTVKILSAIVAPAALGVVSGLLLGASAPAYWVLQVVATIGGFLGGTEHVGWRPGAVRGVIGGALYGVAILVVRAITGWSDEIDLGATPAFLIVITSVVGLLVGAAGGAVRARRS